MIELKKCPFCGGEAKLTHGFCGDMTSYIYCKECHAGVEQVRLSGGYAADEVVAERWNRRYHADDND